MIWHPSPNFNERPAAAIINTVVLHYTDLPTASFALQRLCDPASKVSCHYLIDTDGTCYQLVKDDKRAWHAGVSIWQGRPNVNDFSIGIELQNPGHPFFHKNRFWSPYPAQQLEGLVTLLKALCALHPIKKENIIGHAVIAPERKIDPGPHFPWPYLQAHGF